MASAHLNALQHAWCTLAALPVAWRVRRALNRDPDLPHLLRALETGAPPHRPCEPQRLAQAARTALRVMGVRNRACVPAAMTLYALLRRQDSPATYVSGVRRVDGQLDGHAWVELQGVPVAEGDLSGFTVQFRFDPQSGRR